jgi:uncharacterized protein (DUF433 family)
MAATELTSHVRLDERGVAWVDDTKVKVIEVVGDYLAYGWTPEEMHLHQPHLSLAQIYGAMSYYYDHQKELEAQIHRNLQEANNIQDCFEDKPLRQKLQRAKPAR